MFILIIFAICMSFFIFIKETQISCINYEFNYTQDQLKGLASFIRNHNDFSSINIESDLGISSTFFNNQISVKQLPSSAYIPFDATYLIYRNFIKLKKGEETNEKKQTFLDIQFLILINGTPISSYDIKYYSQFLIYNPNTYKPSECNFFPNIHAMIENYLI